MVRELSAEGSGSETWGFFQEFLFFLPLGVLLEGDGLITTPLRSFVNLAVLPEDFDEGELSTEGRVEIFRAPSGEGLEGFGPERD